jgi:hypothetical protein
MTLLREWQNFYVIMGSAAAALTGLQFVVMALISQMGNVGGEHEIKAFGTPQIVHFGAVLLLAALCTAPGHSPKSLSICLTIAALAALVYTIRAAIHASHSTAYKPVLEDWIWHAALPLAAYSSLLIAGLVAAARPAPALYVVAAAALLLLYVGIHNAWDTALYISVVKRQNRD